MGQRQCCPERLRPTALSDKYKWQPASRTNQPEVMSQSAGEPEQQKVMFSGGQPQQDLLSRLPVEVALRVLALLPAADLLHASAVCCYWRQLATDDSLWHPHVTSLLGRWPPGAEHGLQVMQADWRRIRQLQQQEQNTTASRRSWRLKRRKQQRPSASPEPEQPPQPASGTSVRDKWMSLACQLHQLKTAWQHTEFNKPSCNLWRCWCAGKVTCMHVSGDLVLYGVDGDRSLLCGEANLFLHEMHPCVGAAKAERQQYGFGNEPRWSRLVSSNTVGEGDLPTVTCCQLDDLSQLALAGDEGGGLYAVCADTGEISWRATPLTTGVSALHLLPDRLAVGTETGQVCVLSLTDGTQLASWSAHRAPVFRLLADLPRGRLVSGATDRTLKVWGLQNYQLLHRVPLQLDEPVSTAAERRRTEHTDLFCRMTFDTQYAVTETDGELVICSVLTGRRISTTPLQLVFFGAESDTSTSAADTDTASVEIFLQGHRAVSLHQRCKRWAVWDLPSGSLLHTFTPPASGYRRPLALLDDMMMINYTLDEDPNGTAISLVRVEDDTAIRKPLTGFYDSFIDHVSVSATRLVFIVWTFPMKIRVYVLSVYPEHKTQEASASRS